MNRLFLKFFILFFSSLGFAKGATLSKHRVQLPVSYEMLKKQQQEDNQLIPEYAKDAQSTGAFISSVVDFHLKKYLKKHPNSQFHKVKSLEQSINNQTKIESPLFKIQPKINLTKMETQFHIESLINSKIWLENGFRTFNAEVELYKMQQGLVAIEYRSDNSESKTILGYKQAW